MGIFFFNWVTNVQSRYAVGELAGVFGRRRFRLAGMEDLVVSFRLFSCELS